MTVSFVSSLQSHLGYWLRFVSNHVWHGFSRKLEAYGVTVAQWVFLRELLGQGPVAPSALAIRLGMTRGAISKLADRLVEKQLITRTSSDSDRRYQALEPTLQGNALVPSLATLADENEEEFFGHLGPDEREGLAKAMKAIVRHHGLQTVPVA